jgi:hydrogenase nickel incorporation protein HypB
LTEAGEIIVAREEEMLDIEVERDIIEENERLAKKNRATMDRYGILSIDVMGSIGSGKTALIERMIERVKGEKRIAVIAGDVTTTIDADRVARHGVESIQINTGKECHLDANLVRRALEKLKLEELDILFVENVGNLICPADFALGCQKRLVVVSVTEGEWMVVKHPLIFKGADVAAINKIDLASVMGVDVSKLESDARQVNPKIEVVRTSAKTGEGVDRLAKSLGVQ